MSEALTTTAPQGKQSLALSSAEIRDQVNLIQEVMKAVMKDGIHYGKIPGCGERPTLFKSGAEKILATFKISVEPIVADLSTPDEAKFRVITKGVHMATGITVGMGVGEASSSEEKYKWRGAICDAEFNATPEARKRIKYRKDGSTIKQVRTEPADVANTVLKMAKKRSQIDMTLTATAASDVFSQDIEDLPEELRDLAAEREARREPRGQPDTATAERLANAANNKKPAEQQRQEPAPQASEHANLTVTGMVEDIAIKPGKKANGDTYTRYGVKVNGDYYGTFSDTVGKQAADIRDAQAPCRIHYTDDGKYRNIVTIEQVSDTLPIEDR